MDKDNAIYLGKDVILEVNPFVVPESVEVKRVEGRALKRGLPPKGAGVA